MFRWIAITAALALAVGVAFAQSSPQTQPTLPLGSGQTMGHHMMNGDAMGPAMMDPSNMPMKQMMQMMHLMEAGMMSPGMMDSGMMDSGMGGPMSCNAHAGMAGAPGSYLESRLAFAKAELAIDQARDADWQAFATAVRDQAQPMFHGIHGMHNAAADGSDFPARIDAHIEMLDDRLSGLKAVRAAAVGLYDHLSLAQKQKADTLLPMSLCM
jgi:hypothetical protein